MLAARAAKVHHHALKIALQIVFHGFVHHAINILQKSVHLAVGFQELNHGFVAARESFIFVVAAWVFDESAVEHKTAAVVGFVAWVARFFVRKRSNFHRQRTVRIFLFVETLKLFALHNQLQTLEQLGQFNGQFNHTQNLFDLVNGKRNTG